VWLFVLAGVVSAFVAVLLLAKPILVGQYVGSMAVAYFAFGAILAVANFCERAIAWTAKRDYVKDRFGDWATPRALGRAAIAFAIAFGIFNALLHPFHRVRLCDGGDCVPRRPSAGFLSAMEPNQRPAVSDAAKVWYKQAEAAYVKAGGRGPVPMLVVATAGGGIRAAYWTATVLEKLAATGDVRPYLFAISGVSGGSVGTAAFEAALTKRDENGKSCKPGQAGCPRATQYLTEDFLAPALASLIFVDLPASFLPDFGLGDRGAALERSFEDASEGLLARPFLSFFRYKNDAAASGDESPWWRPILLLNATHEETGNRIITGHVRIDRDVFLDALDALHELGNDVRASTAAHNSARFSYVSPAGALGDDAFGNSKGSVIDGGYFENYGALTALEIGRAAKYALKKEKLEVRLVFLLISSDPSLDRKRTRVRMDESADGKCLVSIAEREGKGRDGDPNYLSVDPGDFENGWLNEFFAPFVGVMSVREAHGNRAAAELAVETCTEIPDASAKLKSSQTQSAATPAARAEASPGQESNEAQLVATSPEAKAATLAEARKVAVDDTKPFAAKADEPYFAHLAMCKEDEADQPPAANDGGAKEPPVQPPLGWVLAKATQERFGELLERCGNRAQLEQLETALGKPSEQEAAASSSPGN
jgi:hypothetical protein